MKPNSGVLKPALLFLVGVCAFLSIAQDAQSCSVPVFRYALERWKPDPYKGIYIYRNEISKEDQKLLEQLNNAAANADSPLNLIIKPVDADTFSKEKLTGLLNGQVPEKLPVLIIWYPDQMGKNHHFLHEKLTPSLVEHLVQSPKRQEMAESLIKGESVVWVFIASGNKKKDDSALVLIRQELDSALEKYSNNPFSILAGAKRKKLTYGFPIMTLSRYDPAERIFVETLMKSEPDLYEHTDEPMVFPVFGRGRSLGCLFGDYITPKNLQGSTAFLSGACSCEVKALNPGIDLLVAAPWDMVVMNSFIEEGPLPELTGVMPGPEEPAGGENSSEVNNAVPDDSSGLFKIYAFSIGGVILIVAVSGFIINRRRRDR